MTEKRFMASINNEVDMDYDVEIWDYNKHLNQSEVVDLLNELNDENQKLKKALCERNVAEQRRREYDEFWNEKIKNMV